MHQIFQKNCHFQTITMTHFYSLVFLFLFALSATNAHAQAINTAGTIQHDGLTREYRLYVPAIYNPAQSTPLLLNLHGYTSNNAQQQVYGNFTSIADTANIILIHPNGTFDANGDRFWNAGFSASGPDDVASGYPFHATMRPPIDRATSRCERPPQPPGRH